MAKVNFEEMGSKLLELVGGKENVSVFTHCVTRLRFTVKDKSKVSDEAVKTLEGVVGTQWLGDQFQVIVGTEVEEAYDTICKISGLEAKEAINENLDGLKTKKAFSLKTVTDAILGYISPTMTGVIPLMMAACLCKTFGALVGPDILGVVAAESELITTLNLMYDAFFYFIPLFLGYSACKSLNMNPIYGIYLGALIMVPGFAAMVGSVESFKVLGLVSVPVADYSSSFLPVILGAVIMSLVYKCLNKVIPDVLKTVFVPTLTIVIMAPVMFGVCGPLGNVVGELLGNLLVAMSQSNIVVKLLGAVLLAVLLPYMVLSGMHGALVTYAIMAFFAAGSESFIMPIMMAYNFAVFGVALGCGLKIKDKGEKAAIFSYFISGILGSVTEPCLYGVVLKYKKAMKALLIASVFVGVWVGLFTPVYYAMSAANIFTFFIPWVAGGTTNIIYGNVLMLGALAVGAVAAFLMKYDAE